MRGAVLPGSTIGASRLSNLPNYIKSKSPEIIAIKNECVRMHTQLDYGCKAIGKRVGKSHVLVRKWLIKAGVYRAGHRSSRTLTRNGKSAIVYRAEKIISSHYSKEIRTLKSLDNLWINHKSVAAYKSLKWWREKATEDYKARKRDRAAAWKKANPDRSRKWMRDYLQKRKDDPKHKERVKASRRKSNKKPINRLKQNIRRRIREVIKQRIKRGETKVQSRQIRKDFGCSTNHLIAHLERNFKPGMTWENYGSYWDCDHIIPIAKHNITNQREALKANHWTNLQPLTKSENQRKGDKVISQANLDLLLGPPQPVQDSGNHERLVFLASEN